MFHGVSLRLLHNPPLEQISALLGRLRTDGCDAISIIPHHYVSLEPGTANLSAPPAGFEPPWFIYPDLGQDPTHPFHNTPEPELVRAASLAAAAMGFQVLIKPHIDCYQAGWRGDISVKDKAADWVWAYKNRFLQRYVSIAKETPNAILCLGCELYTVSKELGAEFWIGVAEWVRAQGFGGPLTYAANWGGWADDAEYRRVKDLWPHLDYIGVDAYYPLFPADYSGPTDRAALVAAWHRKGIDVDWCPRIDEDLIALSQATRKPLLFTEIGYANHKQAPMDPMRDARPDDVRDDDVQLRLAEAFREKWGPLPEFAGYFWWEAWLDSASKAPISHDILDRPLEAIIFRPLPGEPTSAPVIEPTPEPLPPPPPPAPTTEQILARNGIHGPNCRLVEFPLEPNGPPAGAGACWAHVAAARATWIKLLSPDHRRADAEHARSLGLKVLVRAPGEAFPSPAEVRGIIEEFRGVCDVIEVGNEPFPTDQFPTWEALYWNHAFYLEQVWQQCAQPAHDAGMILCAPGWQGGKEPPSPDSVNSQALSDRLRQVYGSFDAIAVHCYDSFNLDIPPVLDRIARWHAVFNKPLYITEYGIAARYLIPTQISPENQPNSDLIKAKRYADFVKKLATLDYVQAEFLFILNGTPLFAAFGDGSHYDPEGNNSYWMTEAAYAAFGSALVSETRDLMPDLGIARDLGARPHGPDFPIQSVPTISLDVFAGVLKAHGSPALHEAAALAYYKAALDRGINPAVALAFFEHESQCGTEGPVAAAGAKNWGNLRPRNDGTIGRAAGKVSTEFGVFRRYATFIDGLLDWCDLMLSVYAGMSIREALKIYAPASDQNDPNSYAATVLRRIAKWDADSGDFALPGQAPAPSPRPAPPAPVTPGADAPADFPLMAPPTMSVETFTAVLTGTGSPALEEADGATFYNLAASNGIDPTVALAFFQQESNCGTADGAAERKNWGNLWDAGAGALGIYPSWLLSLRDWCARLQGPAYTAQGRPTIASIVPIYRPAGAQQHGNAWYIGQLSARISRLHGT
ncbi:MAG TPA: glycosyl hydrolase [Chloroflexia bacterium]|nr:glycosyl hydrolase [Chloroflexia bacterium]